MNKIKAGFTGWLLLTVVFLSSSGGVVWAKDALEAGGENYKLLFENDKVRVLELDFKPGVQIPEHTHPDHFVYILQGGTLRLSYPGGNIKEIEGKTGQVLWISAETHSAENIGGTELKAIVTELKA